MISQLAHHVWCSEFIYFRGMGIFSLSFNLWNTIGKQKTQFDNETRFENLYNNGERLIFLRWAPLKALIEAGFNVVGVITFQISQPGRGQKMMQSAVRNSRSQD